YFPPSDTTCPTILNAFNVPFGVPRGQGLPGGCTRDLVHKFYQEQYQLNGGAQNRYATGSDSAGMSMGVYNTRALPIYAYLHGGDPHYAIADNFRHSVLDRNGMVQTKGSPNAQGLSQYPLYLSPARRSATA